jgi:hypothetical protein
VWVLRNSAGNGLYTGAGQIDKPLANWGNTISFMGIGPAKGTKSINDIVIGTTTGVYVIDQTTLGAYSAPATMGLALRYATISDMVVGDVDGNGYVDVVMSYSGYTTLDLFRNYGSSNLRWYIGDAPNNVNSICIGKVQNS